MEHTIKVFLQDTAAPECTFAHMGVLRDCIYDKIEWIDYPRYMLECREALEIVSYFITNGIVEIGETISFVFAKEFPENPIVFFWGDDIPKDCEIVRRVELKITDIKEY